MYVCVSYLCVSVCERAYYISGTTRPFFSKFLLCPEREAKCCDDRVCVCVCVCVFVRDPIFGTNKTSDLHEFFLRMLPMAVARFPYGGVVIRRVLQVLWMTSHLHISQSQAALGLAINGAYGIPVAGNGRTGLLLTVGIGGNTGGGVCGL